MDKEKLESAILALEDIKKALESEEPVDSFITHWERAQYIAAGVKSDEIYNLVRSGYAENVGYAITALKTFKDGILESPEWWENIKLRIVEYDKNMPYYPDDYKERLIKADMAAIDSVISVLKSQER